MICGIFFIASRKIQLPWNSLTTRIVYFFNEPFDEFGVSVHDYYLGTWISRG